MQNIDKIVAWFSINLYSSKSLVLITQLYKFIKKISRTKDVTRLMMQGIKTENYKWKVTVIFLVGRSPFVSNFYL